MKKKLGNFRASHVFYPNYVHDVAVVGPLWHSRINLELFINNGTSIAVLTGVTALYGRTSVQGTELCLYVHQI